MLRDKCKGFLTGFTLVEMLVVLAVITMLLGISIPFTANFGRGLHIKTAARAILGELRLARSNAITHREEYSVVFDVENHRYWMEDRDGRMIEKKELPRSVRFEIPDTEEADPVTFEADKVTFYPSGAIEGVSGSITISDRYGKSRTISIIGSTGKITVE